MTPKYPVRIAVIGAGKIAPSHLDVLKDSEGVEIVGISNNGGASDVQSLTRRYGVNRGFNDWMQMLDEVEPNGVYILAPVKHIAAVATECLVRRIPSFIEKPAGLSPTETKNLAELAYRQECINMLAVNRRYLSALNAAIRKIKVFSQITGVLVENSEKIDVIRERGRHDEDTINKWIYANAVHAIDLLRHVGGNVSSVKSVKNSLREENGDGFSAVLEYDNGAIGTYISHWYSPVASRIVIYGDGILATCTPFEGSAHIRYGTGQNETIHPDEYDRRYKPGFYAQSRAFINAIAYQEELAPPVSDLNDAWKTMSLIQSIAGAGS